MVPEIFPKKFHNEYYQNSPKDSDHVMAFFGRECITKYVEGGVLLPTVSDYREIDDRIIDSLLYLFCIDDTNYFLYMDETEVIPEGFSKNGLMDLRKQGSTFNYLEIFTAWHLFSWYRDNKFCGRCGKPTRIGREERNLLCDCGNMIFPKIMPAVIVGVRNGDKLLMTKYANRGYTGWALIAGFIEIGETGEECVVREVMEEVGIKVKNVTYYASQPWGIDQDLLLGYYCDVDGMDEIHVDDMELAVGEWVPREEVPERMDLQSLTATMMEAFRRGVDKEKYKPFN